MCHQNRTGCSYNMTTDNSPTLFIIQPQSCGYVTQLNYNVYNSFLAVGLSYVCHYVWHSIAIHDIHDVYGIHVRRVW